MNSPGDEETPFRYNAAMANRIEKMWQDTWRERNIYRVPNPDTSAPSRPGEKRYILDMFPFPSGAGLHVGHPRGYIATDVYARYLRMSGFKVLHTMGFDAFGLPAEQYAVETGTHPRATTEANIAAIRRQLNRLGLGHDPSRSVATTDVAFYRWTQWIFLQIYNSWFDPAAGRARPIAELIAELEAGRPLPDGAGGPDTSTWASLDNAERERFIDGQRLAYLAEVSVNWCPALGTVLANEEVTADGRSERGNHPVYKRPLKQWMLRITAYADRLLEGLDRLEWSDALKTMQRNWIGRKEGAVIRFAVEGEDESVEVFTTRADTLFGATYIVLAPEHRLVTQVATPEQRPLVEAYVASALQRSETERTGDTTKTGVFTGSYAIHPITGDRLPILVADYVLTDYGTGAIMAVPAHDQRDFEFARIMQLPVRAVLEPDDEWLQANRPKDAPAEFDDLRALYLTEAGRFETAFEGHSIMIASRNESLSVDGLSAAEARSLVVEWLSERCLGFKSIRYKLRDWLFSRQRYWGEPIPILHGPNGEIRAVDDEDLPVVLPELEDFRPSTSEDPNAAPRPPLSRAPEAWRVVWKDGDRWLRETNTMPQWAGSCWYYLRYLDPENARRFCDPDVERYWMGPHAGEANHPGGVDLYVGGVEHAVLHLLYARFWHQMLYDLGHVSSPEPFRRLYNQGYVLAAAFRNQRGSYVPAADVVDDAGLPATKVTADDERTFFYNGERVIVEMGKMGKSLKNGVSPDEICNIYGADTLRLYEMSMGPLGASQPWDPRDIIGLHRFLARLWRNVVDERSGMLRVVDEAPQPETEQILATTVSKVRADFERLSFHTAVARLIELNNHLTKLERVPRRAATDLVLMVAPFAPHIAEELWQRLGSADSIVTADFPKPLEVQTERDTVEIPVAVSGKVRAKLVFQRGSSKDAVAAAAKEHAIVSKHLTRKQITRVVYVPDKMLNFVVSG